MAKWELVEEVDVLWFMCITSIVFLPCILPCLIQTNTSIIQNSMEKLAEEKMMMPQTNKQEGTKENLETARVIYEKYQKLRKIYEGNLV